MSRSPRWCLGVLCPVLPKNLHASCEIELYSVTSQPRSWCSGDTLGAPKLYFAFRVKTVYWLRSDVPGSTLVSRYFVLLLLLLLCVGVPVSCVLCPPKILRALCEDCINVPGVVSCVSVCLLFLCPVSQGPGPMFCILVGIL